jgi:hypothetical protein
MVMVMVMAFSFSNSKTFGPSLKVKFGFMMDYTFFKIGISIGAKF